MMRIAPQHETLRSGAEFESQPHRLLRRPRKMRMILPRAIPYLYIFISYHRSNMQDHRIDFARFCATNLGGVFCFVWRLRWNLSRRRRFNRLAFKLDDRQARFQVKEGIFISDEISVIINVFIIQAPRRQ